jgi:hypothetical protein
MEIETRTEKFIRIMNAEFITDDEYAWIHHSDQIDLWKEAILEDWFLNGIIHPAHIVRPE